MKGIRDADLAGPMEVFAVANTPLFLIRKLRQEPVVSDIARSFSGKEILGALQDALEREQTELQDIVAPYVYVVALSFEIADQYLNEAAKLPNLKKWDWLEYILQVLAESYTPTTRQPIVISGEALRPQISFTIIAPFADERLGK